MFEQEQKYMSALPFMPPLNEKTLQQYYALYALFFLSVTLFGALVAPIAELKLGLGGESSLDSAFLAPLQSSILCLHERSTPSRIVVQITTWDEGILQCRIVGFCSAGF